MLTILVLFVGLTLATAVIAYWSDNLGKKLGKKRVSLWGMRPRTTATFLTIASSWLIMVFTLGVMLALFSPLRQALLRYDEVKADVNDLNASKTLLTGQVSSLDGQLSALRGQTTELKSRVKEASANLEKVGVQLKQSRAAAQKARAERTAARADADAARKSAQTYSRREQAAIKRESAARKNLTKVTAQRDATQQQRAAAQRELTRAQAELTRARTKVEAATARVQAARARVQQAEAKVARAETELGKVEVDLTKVRTDLTAARANEKLAVTNAATANADAATARQNAAKSQLAAQEAETRAADANVRAKNAKDAAFKAGTESIKAGEEVVKAQQRVAQLRAQSAELFAANKAVVDANSVILASNIRVPVGRTLVSRSFEPNLSFSAATEGLRALFGRAAQQIVPNILPGAKLELAARPVLAPKENPSDPDLYVIVEGADIYQGLADTISRSQNSLSVRLVSNRNHLEGEDVLEARFIVVPIRPALPAGEELASAVFDKNLGDARLFSALLKLADAGREVATRNGVTPPLSPEAPDFYATGSNEQIFEALRKITAQDGLARVTIVTAQPISTADQLSVRFEVEPAATTARAPAKRGAAPA